MSQGKIVQIIGPNGTDRNDGFFVNVNALEDLLF